MPNLKENKTVPVPPSEANKQPQNNLENRDTDSKLPVEEDAGIHSKIIHWWKLSTTCFLLCRPPSSVPMQSHGLDRGKIQRAAPPKASPETQATPNPPRRFKYGMRMTENNLENKCMNEWTGHRNKQKCIKLLRHLACILCLVSESNRTTIFCNIFIFNKGAISL